MSNQNSDNQDVAEEPSGNSSTQLQNRVIHVLGLPETAVVDFAECRHKERQGSLTGTRISICVSGMHSHEHMIAKPLAAITDEDIKLLRAEHHVKPAFLGQLFRFFGWWLGFTGLYAMFTVCPFCGQQGCPVGAGGAGVVGGFFALCMQNWKAFVRFLAQKLFRAD